MSEAIESVKARDVRPGDRLVFTNGAKTMVREVISLTESTDGFMTLDFRSGKGVQHLRIPVDRQVRRSAPVRGSSAKYVLAE